jgi:hypothetical protein
MNDSVGASEIARDSRGRRFGVAMRHCFGAGAGILSAKKKAGRKGRLSVAWDYSISCERNTQ